MFGSILSFARMSSQTKHWDLGLLSFPANVKPNFKYSELFKQGFSIFQFLLIADGPSTIQVLDVFLGLETDALCSFGTFSFLNFKLIHFKGNSI